MATDFRRKFLVDMIDASGVLAGAVDVSIDSKIAMACHGYFLTGPMMKCPSPELENHHSLRSIPRGYGPRRSVEVVLKNGHAMAHPWHHPYLGPGGTPKSSILVGFSVINRPFRGTPI